MQIKVAVIFLAVIGVLGLAALVIFKPTLYLWIFCALLLVWAFSSGGLKKLAFYLVWFGFPILVMGNCDGGNEGSMKVQSCMIDFPLARSLANGFYAVVLLSAIPGMGIPYILYGVGGWFIGRSFDVAVIESEGEDAT